MKIKSKKNIIVTGFVSSTGLALHSLYVSRSHTHAITWSQRFGRYIFCCFICILEITNVCMYEEQKLF